MAERIGYLANGVKTAVNPYLSHTILKNELKKFGLFIEKMNARWMKNLNGRATTIKPSKK
jgi:hypothetical protein